MCAHDPSRSLGTSPLCDALAIWGCLWADVICLACGAPLTTTHPRGPCMPVGNDAGLQGQRSRRMRMDARMAKAQPLPDIRTRPPPLSPPARHPREVGHRAHRHRQDHRASRHVVPRTLRRRHSPSTRCSATRRLVQPHASPVATQRALVAAVGAGAALPPAPCTPDARACSAPAPRPVPVCRASVHLANAHRRCPTPQGLAIRVLPQAAYSIAGLEGTRTHRLTPGGDAH